MKHIVLCGDSIFDNKSYTNGGPDVITHLRERIGDGGRATLLAVDGNVVANVAGQLRGLPADATHIVVSVGGNDALGSAGILQLAVRSSAEVFNELADIAGDFECRYREMLAALTSTKLPFAVCTVYFPRMPEPLVQKVSVAALASFNDVITRLAFEHGVPLIDLRLVCNEDADYANEIEPSVAGGRKIAEVIDELITTHDFDVRRTSVYA